MLMKNTIKRPKADIKYLPVDYIVESASAILTILLIILPIYFYNQLPDTIPTHFNALGEPDSYGSKNTIWILPVIGLILYVGLTILNKYPHVFNYPVEVTESNAGKLYQTATRVIRILKLIITSIFVYLCYGTINSGINDANGLGTWFLPVFIVIIAVLLVSMLLAMYRNR